MQLPEKAAVTMNMRNAIVLIYKLLVGGGGVVAVEYPYVLTANKFQEFLGDLSKTGVPPRIHTKFIESLGYKSKNDRKFIGVLRFLGLIDDSGIPTGAYRSTLRHGEQGRAELARLTRESYADLFATYPDAHRKDNEALQNFFTAHTDLGRRAVQAMADTFKVVCSFADFEAEAPAHSKNTDEQNAPAENNRQVVQEESIGTHANVPENIGFSSQPLTINVNIQLELPATSETDVYEALFASMAKHIMRLPQSE